MSKVSPETRPDANWAKAMGITLLLGLVVGGLHLRDWAWKSPNDGFNFPRDRVAHVTGANYFIQQPWQFPLFDISGYRFPEGGSLVYTDGIPLVGSLVKLTYPLHGTTVDYFGWYVLLCYALQSVGLVLVLRGCGIRHLPGAITGALLAVASPVLLYRIGHPALCSHFLIFLAFAVYLKAFRDRTPLFWSCLIFILLGAALLIHPYMFLMVGMVLAACCLQALLHRRIQLRDFLCIGLLIPLLLVGLMLISGHLRTDVEVGARSGFGIYSMNVLSPFWPYNSGLFPGQLPVLDATGGQYEGYAWMGMGVVFLILAVIFLCPKQLLKIIRQHPVLAAILVIMTLISISNRVFFGQTEVLNIPLQGRLLEVMETFRSSGRFFWPVNYAILTAALVVLWRTFSPRKAILLVSIATVLQLADIRPFIQPGPDPMTKRDWRLQQDGHLRDFMALHEQVVLLPAWQHVSPESKTSLLYLQLLASQVNIPLSSSYQASVFNPRSAEEDRRLYLAGKRDPDTLYLLLMPDFEKEVIRDLDPAGTCSRRWATMLLVSEKIDALESQLEGTLFHLHPVGLSTSPSSQQ